MVDFIIRRGRDKSNLNIFPSACLTRNMQGKEMVEFGLLSAKGIVGFNDPYRVIQNTEIMSRIMDYASDMGTLIIQHPEDFDLSKDGLYQNCRAHDLSKKDLIPEPSNLLFLAS